jgi:RNA polymerase sigma factor (sigma-70 family)
MTETQGIAKYTPMIFAVVLRMGLDKRDEDLMQEGRFAVLRCLRVLDPARPTYHAVFVYKAIYRAAARYRRRMWAYSARNAPMCAMYREGDGRVGSFEENYPSAPDQELDRVSGGCGVEDLVALAHPTERGMLRMRSQGYTLDEIGEHFGVSRARASVLLSRAFDRVRNNLTIAYA